MSTRASGGIAVLLGAMLVIGLVLPGLAAPPANEHFERTWARTDKPVADGVVAHTWMWGPEAFTGSLTEPYIEGPDGEREVQYFDKARMEITAPDADPNSIWYVTNGLLVVELITGNLQLGHDTFEQHAPADVNVAGDPDDPDGPTYQTYAGLLDLPPHPQDSVITQRVSRDGTITDDPSLAVHGATAAEHVDVPGINHRVASPFWAFMNSSGTVYENGGFANAALFENPYYATGLPITEAYWAEVRIAGTPQDVLTQCFERRCLTYNPLNESAWQVEAGNVGLHYHHWRYTQIPDEEVPEPTATAEPNPTATVEPEPTLTPTVEPDPTPVTDYGAYAMFGEPIDILNFMLSPQGVAVSQDGDVYISDTTRQHVQRFDDNGVYLTRWGEQGNGTGEFETPRGMAVDSDGNLYVADSLNHRVQKFSADGTWLAEFGSFGNGPGEFATPWDVAIDSDDNVYVLSIQTNKIQKLTSNGQYILQWGDIGNGPGEFTSPRGIAVDSHDNVYVIDRGNHRVQAYTSTGSWFQSWGSPGNLEGQFQDPVDIAISPDDVIYVIDAGLHRVQMFETDSNLLGGWGQQGNAPSLLNEPVSIAIGPDGTVYIVEAGNQRVKVYTADGEWRFNWHDDRRGRFATALGFALEADGSVYIGDYMYQNIQKFTPQTPGQFDYVYDETWRVISGTSPVHMTSDNNGRILVADGIGHRVVRYPLDENQVPNSFGGLGQGPGEYDWPFAVATDDDGFIYIADRDNHRIQKVATSGWFIAEWGAQGAGAGQFNSPTGITIHQGRVYVVDSMNHRVQIFDLDGEYIGQWGTQGAGPAEFDQPVRVAVDSHGHVYVTDAENHRVQKFTTDGDFITMFGTPGDGLGQMTYPVDIAISDDGYVFVLESGNARIQVWGPAI